MFGISFSEFLIILTVAVLIIPARLWPDVIKFIARLVKGIRGIIWKITESAENIKEQIDMEKPIDELVKKTTDDILSGFSTKIPKKSKKATKK